MNIRDIVMLVLLLVTPSISLAYVGPGVGLTAITSLLALGSAFFITIFGFLWLPIKRFFKGEQEDEASKEYENDDSENSNDKKD